MKEITTTVTSGGQITLPAEVRRLLGIKIHDRVVFAIEDHEVKLLPARYTIQSLAGSVQPPTKTEKLEELLDEAKEEMASRANRKE